MSEKTSMRLPRAAGVILHPTSLSNSYGIGDLGPAAKNFIDFLASSGITYWQMLPMGPTGYADSPYQNISAFAGNPLVISPEVLVSDGLLDAEFLAEKTEECNSEINENPEKVSFDPVHNYKEHLFEQVFEGFINLDSEDPKKKAFELYCQSQQSWLNDYALFYSLKKAHELKAWWEWESEYIQRDQQALEQWKEEKADDIQFIKFQQWLFQEQWDLIRTYAHEKGVYIIGDMPIFVAHDSADVWVHSEYFTMNEDGTLEYQAGVPPDYFSKTGQLWGNPLYRWELLQEQNFEWFIQRLERWMNLMDWIRIDHFRGFEAYWRIPGQDKTAIGGEWIKSPGKELFMAVREKMGNIPIIAEDLGVITPEVEALRDEFEFPGMRVLQFAFGSDGKNPHLPHNYVHNSIVYTGTHDNDTSLGWWEKAPDKDKSFFSEYFGIENPIMPLDLIKVAFRSVANLAVVPMQDLLEQNSDARMNTPSVPQGNWQYRMPDAVLTPEKSKWILNLVTMYRRNPRNNQ
jgi:4-alpha-glucanotransferase